MPQTKFGKLQISYQDQGEYHHLKREIFSQHLYLPDHVKDRLEARGDQAFKIIDVGAHIGLATLYFSWIFPEAQITAIEPLPQNLHHLEQNIWLNGLESRVTIVPVAVGLEAGTLTLHTDPAREWTISTSIHPGGWNSQQTTEPITVPAQPLSDFLQEPVDILKMDIEGAELEVLSATQSFLSNVSNLMVEFHPTPTQSLGELLKLLEKTHSVSIQSTGEGLSLVTATR